MYVYQSYNNNSLEFISELTALVVIGQVLYNYMIQSIHFELSFINIYVFI